MNVGFRAKIRLFLVTSGIRGLQFMHSRQKVSAADFAHLVLLPLCLVTVGGSNSLEWVSAKIVTNASNPMAGNGGVLVRSLVGWHEWYGDCFVRRGNQRRSININSHPIRTSDRPIKEI